MKNLINKLAIISLSAFAVGAMSPAFAHDSDFFANSATHSYKQSILQHQSGSASVNAERSI